MTKFEKRKIFISFSKSDEKTIKEIKNLFSHKGVVLENDPGQEPVSNFNTAVTKRLIVIVSKRYLTSSICMHKAIPQLANTNIQVVPIFIDGLTIQTARTYCTAFWEDSLKESQWRRDVTIGTPSDINGYITNSLPFFFQKLGEKFSIHYDSSYRDIFKKIDNAISLFDIELQKQEKQPIQKKESLSLYFSDEYNPEEIAEILLFISDLYWTETGDQLVIKGTDVYVYDNVLEPQLM